ncbi:ribonuclease BN (tRNA processing enzyme) [Oceanisphaera litoralis]|uniref:MBL fold metallo-hydrolase n=1 Tax=Oceanisphaera litoralis TaxID=225144 RepID=UPI00195CC985|nr:MBL fold metallo-hydrolase [Oceanisphaera litoralis]MBM7456636.1 ribonuclease BN (tRNA processing enzyme) [Oceanisphaera litoralis]
MMKGTLKPLLMALALAGLAPTAALAESRPATAAEVKEQSQTHVVMLGTGTPTLHHKRAGQAILVVVDKQMYLFDAGPGFVRNFEALSGRDFMPPYTQFVNESVYGAIDKVFITHLDSDHVLGLPELLLRPWVLGRDQPMKVIGPKGTAQLVEHSLKAFKEDIDHRLYGTQPANANGYKGEVTEISETQIVHQDDKVTVKAFRVPHGSWDADMSFGYRVETPTRTIVISGDTRKDEANYEHFRGADILIHEVMHEGAISRMPQDWQKYMYHAHTSTRQLAEIAKEVKPGLLVMNHPLFFGATDEDMVADLAKHYDGNFVLAQDLDIYE